MTAGSNTRQAAFFARWARRAAYAACGWAFLFAALSFFWAAGGRTGLQPLEQQTGPFLMMLVWAVANIIAGLLKLSAGLVALVLTGAWDVRLWERRQLHRLLYVATW